MKRILLAGYGNIAKSFVKIMEEQEDPSSYQITVCEIKDGNDIMEYLPKNSDKFDLLINCCLADSLRLSAMCGELDLDYIDVGIIVSADDYSDVVSYDYIELMKELISIPTPNSRMLLGFGINPGILEHIYQKYKPAGKHYAFQLEHDMSESDECDVFGTWTPYMYYEESVLAEKVFVGKNDSGSYVLALDDKLEAYGGAIQMSYHDKTYKYVPISHEELISMVLAEPNLLGTGYLFQAPKGMQEHYLEQGPQLTLEEVFAIPVLDNLQGKDEVGMLFWDLKDDIYWIKNVTHNQETWRRYGCNSVCWQTATGAWIGYKMIDKLACDHPHTMTEVSQQYSDDIDRLLDQIGLRFEREDHVFDVEEFKERIIKFFNC